MNSRARSSGQHLAQWCVVTVLILIFGLGTVQAVQASCGDYLVMPEHGPIASAPMNDHSRPSPAPCRGPQCRQRGPLETPPAPLSVSVELRQLAASLFDENVSINEDRSWQCAASSLRPVLQLPHRLDRPPRAA
jgi:hypothetical protein